MPIDEADAAAGGERQQRHHQADARAVDQAAQDIAPERVGAEDVAHAAAVEPERRQQLVAQGLIDRRIGREQRREQRHADHDGDDADRNPRRAHGAPSACPHRDADSRASCMPCQPDPRIDVGVQNVDRQVDRQDQHRLQDDDRLQQREVAIDHRLVGQPADAGPGEHRLRDDRAGDQIADEHAPQRQHRDQRVAQAMLPDHHALAQSLDARQLDEFAVHHLQHAGAHQAHEAGDQESCRA